MPYMFFPIEEGQSRCSREAGGRREGNSKGPPLLRSTAWRPLGGVEHRHERRERYTPKQKDTESALQIGLDFKGAERAAAVEAADVRDDGGGWRGLGGVDGAVAGGRRRGSGSSSGGHGVADGGGSRLIRCRVTGAAFVPLPYAAHHGCGANK